MQLVEQPSGALKIPSLVSNNSLYLSLVVPTYNEGANIEKLVEQVTSVLGPILGHDYEIIIVDDDSPDSTWHLAQSLVSQYPQLRVMRRMNERGLATAVIRGWQVARSKRFQSL